ncbi:hypothetical protein SRIMM317S_07335 [Streptomyces rimosus subsp. rimosus]
MDGGGGGDRVWAGRRWARGRRIDERTTSEACLVKPWHPRGARSSPLWLQELRRQAGKPSYAQVVRRSRRRYRHATVRESTISDMLNGKRLPRWETVERVAWALGGEEAVAACRQRWIEADMARTPPVPLAPPVPRRPGGAVGPGGSAGPGGCGALRCPDISRSRRPSGTDRRRSGAGRGRQRSRPCWSGAGGGPSWPVGRWWPPRPWRACSCCRATDTGPARAPRQRASLPTRSRTAGQNAAKASLSPSSVPQPAWTPGTAMLTAHSCRRPVPGRPGHDQCTVGRRQQHPGVVYSVITPWTTCQVSGGSRPVRRDQTLLRHLDSPGHHRLPGNHTH